MFTLAHFSDPHLGPMPDPRLWDLMSKRIIGYVNWLRNRRLSMGGNYLTRLLADIQAHEPDHIAITGDLVNIALKAEIESAARWLETIGPPHDVSLVPGNHDAYVPGAITRANVAWAPFMRGDGHLGPIEFPYARRRGDIVVIGLSTARASGPWLANGHLGTRQAKRLLDMLEHYGHRDLFRIVLIHHPPIRRAAHWSKRLLDASRVRAALRRFGAELILHGHTHLESLAFLPGKDGRVPVVGVPAASAAPGGSKPGARYNLFQISRVPAGWSCRFTERGFIAPHGNITTISQIMLPVPSGQPHSAAAE